MANGHSRREIWILSAFSSGTDAVHSDRYDFVAAECTRRGMEVRQFLSSFDHRRKKPRKQVTGTGRKLEYVRELGYASNLTYRRLVSHALFGCLTFLRMVVIARTEGVPDVVFVCLPHNLAAWLAVLFCKWFGVRIVLDIHDTWPQSVLSVYRLGWWMRPFYDLWKHLADSSIREADHVIAESRLYAAHGKELRREVGKDDPVPAIYLGGDPGRYAAIPPAEALPPEIMEADVRFAYVGNLGVNYDLFNVLEAFEGLRLEGRVPVLVFLGGGDLESKIVEFIRERGLRAWVSGILPHERLISCLKVCHIGINSFCDGGNVAYSYKLNDYFLTGLPVLNSLQGEAADLVAEAGLGRNYLPGDPASLRDAMADLAATPLEPLVRNVKAFTREHLDRTVIYKPLFRLLEGEGGPA